MNARIAITALSTISALGATADEIWRNYQSQQTHIQKKLVNKEMQFMACIRDELQAQLQIIRTENTQYPQLDASVIYAMWVARQALEQSQWGSNRQFGVFLGSSRGATQQFENHHSTFLDGGTVSPHSSPTTTLGNLASTVARDLKANGPSISLSVTCSTSLHAIMNAVAWLRSGMESRFLAGGSEAALTSFTLHQMQALKIYARGDAIYPCRALDLTKTFNSMVLGEAAGIACLDISSEANAIAYIDEVGYATDDAFTSTGLSEAAICFQKSMRMAIKNTDPSEIDVVVMHAPGTIKGDLYEWQAIERVFSHHMPMCTSNKWKIGHTLGASGILSLQMAVLMLQHQYFIPVPYIPLSTRRKQIRKILVNAVGFGGNAVSILLSR
ncbi:beta-ketoacyl synthase N-terminal-like domain-containing protein [Undibacterium sp.]|uniref:beta-ketoacyl synthase N-terminal-like domain-containing protein n=1 Tax=Undibacterium sp. TaxID=1914977 RepID=UPI003750C9F3